jgi:hypothetical protein
MCPLHGPQLCCLISPDLVDLTELPCNDVMVISLTDGGDPKFYVTITPAFAIKCGITTTKLPIEYSYDWFESLKSMCCVCYENVWPHLINGPDSNK